MPLLHRASKSVATQRLAVAAAAVAVALFAAVALTQQQGPQMTAGPPPAVLLTAARPPDKGLPFLAHKRARHLLRRPGAAAPCARHELPGAGRVSAAGVR